jgi:hypothetical protein
VRTLRQGRRSRPDARAWSFRSCSSCAAVSPSAWIWAAPVAERFGLTSCRARTVVTGLRGVRPVVPENYRAAAPRSLGPSRHWRPTFNGAAAQADGPVCNRTIGNGETGAGLPRREGSPARSAPQGHPLKERCPVRPMDRRTRRRLVRRGGCIFRERRRRIIPPDGPAPWHPHAPSGRTTSCAPGLPWPLPL